MMKTVNFQDLLIDKQIVTLIVQFCHIFDATDQKNNKLIIKGEFLMAR